MTLLPKLLHTVPAGRRSFTRVAHSIRVEEGADGKEALVRDAVDGLAVGEADSI